MKINQKRVLYFIKGRMPSAEQLARGKEHGAVFRNANMVLPGDKCEPCDAVMGHVPEQYKKAKGVEVISVKAPANKAAAAPKAPEVGKGTTTPPAPAVPPAAKE